MSVGGSDFRLARTMAAVGQSALRDLLQRASRPDVISFAVGLPATELFPVAELAAAQASLLPEWPQCMQYALPCEALKDEVVRLMAGRGVTCRREQVFLTSGAQQGMDLVTRLLLDPGGQVLHEATVYDGIQQAVRRLMPQLLTVTTDGETGLDVEAVADLLRRGHRPAFIYVIPNGHNPLGVSLPRDRRRSLVALARQYRVPLVEDDAYGLLHYGEHPEPPLRALDERWVLYLGSFSKILAPALRAGWMVVPAELIPRLSALKHAADLDTPSFTHWIIARYLSQGHLPAHLERLRHEYQRRRDAMLQALADHFPSAARWNRPASGMFLWVELPPHIDTTALLTAAIDTAGVAFSPGEAFAAASGRHANHCLRLSFTSCPPDRIQEGIRRLGVLLTASLRPQ